MQNASARVTENVPQIIKVGANECRIAREGDRLVARAVLGDVVVAMQVPSVSFAAMLRFSAPEEAGVSALRLEALWEFVDQALALVFEGIRSMDLPAGAMLVSAIGGADVDDLTHGHGSELAAVVEKTLSQHGITLSGSDLGGTQTRGVWLDSSSGRLIVRSASLPTIAEIAGASAAA